MPPRLSILRHFNQAFIWRRPRSLVGSFATMREIHNATLCVLGCGNMGTAVLKSLINTPEQRQNAAPFSRFIACVRSERSEKRLKDQFTQFSDKFIVSKGQNVKAVQDSEIIILGSDPADVHSVLTQPGLSQALSNKLFISVAAGWSRESIESTLSQSGTECRNGKARVWVIRTNPSITALVAQSVTVIEEPDPSMPPEYLEITMKIFESIGTAVMVPPKLMNAALPVGGSTPAFFAIICDAMIVAAVAVGVPRSMAHDMVAQSMLGSATLLKNGTHPGVLKDQGTSPEGCTIGGLMVLEEAGVRGHVGRAIREAVTVACRMDGISHVNDTRH